MDQESIPPQSEPIIPPSTPPARKFSPLLILAAVILLLAVGVSGLILGKSLNNSQSSVSPTVAPIPTQIPTPTLDPTASWKTYINTSAKYSIEHPPTWKAENYGLMDAKPAEPDTKYVSLRFQPDSSKEAKSLEIEESLTIPTTEEARLNEVKIIGTQSSKCWSTGDSMTTFCWVKVPNMQKYLNFHIGNYKNLDDKKIIDQILSTFKFASP